MIFPATVNMFPFAADLVLLGGVIVILLLDLLMPPGDKRVLGGLTILTLLLAFAVTFFYPMDGEAWGGAYVGTPMALFFKRVFYVGGMLGTLGARQQAIAEFTRRQGEYFTLILVSVFGMSLLAGVRDVVLLVVAFETMGIPLYVLSAYAREDKKAVEGALKLFLVGAASSATMLFGLSLLFGLAGSTSIPAIAQHVAEHRSPLAMVGTAMLLGGMGFKIGVFPFHMWVPDTYEGSRTPFIAFLSAAPKVAGFALLIQLLLPAGGALLTIVLPVLLALAVMTLFVGNFFAIQQSNVKRLLAYSGIAHVGFLLLALATGTEFGIATLLFYSAGYVFTNMGAFLVVHAMGAAGGDDSVASFDGLFRRSGWLSLAMLCFLLSLAGIPFVVGFWAKLFVFMAIWQAGYPGLVLLGAGLSVLALFYYLRVVRAMFMNTPRTDAHIDVDPATNAAIALCLAGVVGIGLYPTPVFEAARLAAVGVIGH